MRFQVNIELGGAPPFRVKTSYRRNITSLIKEALGESPLFEKYYGDTKKNIPKPFTFSLSLPVQKAEKGSLILGDGRIRLYFSSCDHLFLTEVYNGLLKLKSGFTAFKPYEMELKNFYLQKHDPITEEETVFKTHSPILVRDIRESKGKGFIDFEHPKFQNNLFSNIRNICQNFISRNYELSPEQMEITPVKCRSAIIRNYGGELGTSGIIKIKAPLEVLQLIHDAGLGAKRSQGFGMMEVIG